MKLGIMQPYFFPYIGYFQLMNAVDEFVVYDNIEYTKKGWINRNRILVNGKDEYITLPLKKDSDYLDIKERSLADSWPTDRIKMLNKIRESYRKAPFFQVAYPVCEASLLYQDANLFSFLLNSLNLVKEYLIISTPLVVSSTIPIDHKLKAADKVLAICRAKQAEAYINPIGGIDLYDKLAFQNEAVALNFLKTDTIQYDQHTNVFIPALSIIDVMMYNSREQISSLLILFQLV